MIKESFLCRVFNLAMLTLAVFCAIVGINVGNKVGYLGMCLVAWISFFSLTLIRDYSGGLFIYMTAQVFMLAFTAVICADGDIGELGRAIMLGIIPIFAGFAMVEFLRKIRTRNVPGLFRMH